MIKVNKCAIPPPSLAKEKLKAAGSYRKEDVVAQLVKDFSSKCYLCEIKPVQDPEVEHLLPHHNGAFPEREFDWNNLFYSCGHCNGIKNHPQYEGKIIDCCQEDPEEQLRFDIREKAVDVSPYDSGTDKAKMTAQLIDEIFNTTSTGIRTESARVRFDGLQQEMDALYQNLLRLKSSEPIEIIQARKAIPGLLNKKSLFAAFKRYYVRTHLADYPELEEYVKLNE